ncbi:MAG: TerB family tellurite resistance protein [Candidatus Eisenbacteria bacterium]|uniref:TerB family tellurite resistance protein n=1 Tax=Eiseniibacteriota bacterium TaxID=2212470 RepID=A0A948W5A5_UNCEI|nr:TerB family tellurite resistance protein [Candidatus Eisenbacteria bacterium]MBU1948305.1 TerB family tellurite resistance protein [Candidatus Eisenbacteria bacterium]MBU2693097.1 TerB family tellurite resistance protein [Candidatus Eisenbacteria bacterium]
MSILRFLGFGGDEASSNTHSSDSETVRRIVKELEAMDRDKARYLAAFAYVLSRVANADLDISDMEIKKMEELVTRFGRLTEEHAVLVVQIAKSQTLLFGATEDFVVTREFKEMATHEQRKELLHCLFAVSAADDSISSAEEEMIRRISDELGFDHDEYINIRSGYNHLRDVMKNLPGSS